jgi:hypothetical protein
LALVGYKDLLGLRDVVINLSASFLFVPAMNLVLLARAVSLGKERNRFFWRELTNGGTTFVIPRFVVDRKLAKELQREGRHVRFQRPNPHFRAFARYRIDVPVIVAENDIEALSVVSNIFRDAEAHPTKIMSDEAVMSNTDLSFISFGLSSNECTHLYLNEADAPLFSLVNEKGQDQFIRLLNGSEYKSDSRKQFGLILRYRPKMQVPAGAESRPGPRGQEQPGEADLPLSDHRWFLIAGLGPSGTPAAGKYLVEHWRRLGREIPPNSDFVVVISTGTYADHIPHLEEILISS